MLAGNEGNKLGTRKGARIRDELYGGDAAREERAGAAAAKG